MHVSLFSDRLIIFQTYQFKEFRHFETTEQKNRVKQGLAFMIIL